MYSDKKSKGFAPLLVFLGLALLCGLLLALRFGGAGRDLSEESAAAIRDAVRRSALQCYAVEGVYPPNLAYLEENYGLQVNTRDFYVVYDAFSSNLPPTVQVLRK